MDRSQDLAKASKTAWCSYKENHQIDHNLLYNLLTSFFPNHRFERVNSTEKEGLIPLCKDNNIIVFIVSRRFAIYESDANLAIFSGEIEDRNVLMIIFSSEGIELVIYFSKRYQTFGRFKVIKFKKGIIPFYFLDLIKKRSSTLSPIEFILILCDVSCLEKEFLNNLMSNYDNSKENSKEFFLAYIATLLLYTNFIREEYFNMLLRRERNKSRFISLKSLITY